jgi:hypothetical protein
MVSHQAARDVSKRLKLNLHVVHEKSGVIFQFSIELHVSAVHSQYCKDTGSLSIVDIDKDESMVITSALPTEV